MPKSIQSVSTHVCNNLDILAIGLGWNLTPPPVGTHWRNVKRIHAGTKVKVLVGFKDGLENITTVDDLRAHVACYLRLANQLIMASRVLVFGYDHRTLHGRKHIN